MNRISSFLEEPPEEYGDFFVIAGEFGAACVTAETARSVKAVLARPFEPRWTEFRDLAGSLVRVRTRLIRAITESTAAQRAADRRFDRARQLEQQDNRPPWEAGD
jgi:hypothetical protein